MLYAKKIIIGIIVTTTLDFLMSSISLWISLSGSSSLETGKIIAIFDLLINLIEFIVLGAFVFETKKNNRRFEKEIIILLVSGFIAVIFNIASLSLSIDMINNPFVFITESALVSRAIIVLSSLSTLLFIGTLVSSGMIYKTL